MNNQKNRFWTFCLSLVPGAGEMYFGLYKEGVSLMLAFFLLFLLPMIFELAPFALLAVILWFYSFLHTHNLRSMPLEEFCQLEDRFFWEGVDLGFSWDNRYRGIAAVALIVIGAYLLWDNLFGWLTRYLPGVFYNFVWRLPRLVVGVLIILLGVWLISGKRKKLEQEEQTQGETVTNYTDIPVYRPEFAAQAPEAPAAPPRSGETDAAVDENAAETGEEDGGHADA